MYRRDRNRRNLLHRKSKFITMINIIYYTTLIAIFSIVYKEILSHQNVLNWWFRFGIRYENRWFWKPIWGCSICFSGQIALWTYLGNWIGSYLNQNAPFPRFLFFLIPEYHPNDFSVISLVIFISLSILQTKIIINLLKKWNLND